MAARLRVEPSKDFYIQTALFDAQSGNPSDIGGTYFRVKGSDGQLAITEFAFFSGRENDKVLYGKYSLGFWSYTGTFPDLQSGNPSTSHGVYGMTEQAVNKAITLFVKYGTASQESNRISSCLTAGFTVNGLIPGREKDRFGFGVARVTNSSNYMQMQDLAGIPAYSDETAFEASYRIEIMRGVALQPDLQLVNHPDSNPDLQNPLLGMMRLELKF
jgi:porin